MWQTCACGNEHEHTYRKKCRDCYNDYMRDYMQRRYALRRAVAVEHLGSKCVDCGNMSNLEFDHVDRELKTEDIGQLMTYSTARFWLEIKKCVLRCRACHQVKTSREQSVEHGGGVTGKKNCYCDKCAPLKREYMREWRNNRRSGDQ
jgi:hypothetical protein